MIDSSFLTRPFIHFTFNLFIVILLFIINNKDKKVINSKLFGAKSKMVEAIPNDYRPEEALFVPKAFAAD